MTRGLAADGVGAGVLRTPFVCASEACTCKNHCLRYLRQRKPQCGRESEAPSITTSEAPEENSAELLGLIRLPSPLPWEEGHKEELPGLTTFSVTVTGE